MTDMTDMTDIVSEAQHLMFLSDRQSLILLLRSRHHSSERLQCGVSQGSARTSVVRPVQLWWRLKYCS